LNVFSKARYQTLLTEKVKYVQCVAVTSRLQIKL
jgi:hypothetical protein